MPYDEKLDSSLKSRKRSKYEANLEKSVQVVPKDLLKLHELKEKERPRNETEREINSGIKSHIILTCTNVQIYVNAIR